MKIRLFTALLLAAAPAAMAQPVAGLWDAAIHFKGADIPFKLEIAGNGPNVRGWFFNGDDKVLATGGSYENGSLVLNFGDYAAKLEATLKDGELVGQYGPMLNKTYPVTARRHQPEPKSTAAAPSISGLWEIAVKSGKGELAWRFIVQQHGVDVSAAILRVDGDTGALTGSYKDGKFVLSHFSGGRPSMMVITPAADGSLALEMTDLFGTTQRTALRPEMARAKGLAPPADPDRHTTVKDRAEPFRFSFPDLTGKIVSNTDAQFQGKVVLVNVTGSWCPNCHDEAPFLEEMYKKYRAKGVEVVGVDFEEADQLQDPVRMRAFAKRYGTDYTVLIAGATGEVNEKLSQMKNFNAWPTTFFIGKDGRVAHVHAGFPSSASGKKYAEAKQDFTQTVERLLAVKAAPSQ